MATMQDVELSDAPLTTNALLAVPFDKRWDLVKPVIQQLYLVDKIRLSRVQEIMRERYGFDASESQYKYHINRKWSIRKNVPTSKKAAMVGMRQARAMAGSQSKFAFKGQTVDDKKLRRHVKDNKRLQRTSKTQANVGEAPAISLAASKIILNWNIPYGAMRVAGERNLDTFSPFAAISTPSDVVVATPVSQNPRTPQEMLSPLSRAIAESTALQRARMFLDGRHDELMKSMDKLQRRTLSNWLYQFWLFSFKTAKSWGRGPRRWNADLLSFDRYPEFALSSTTNTPRGHIEDHSHTVRGLNMIRSPEVSKPTPRPSDLCRWSVHTKEVVYCNQDIEDSNGSISGHHRNDDPDNEVAWKEWPQHWREPDISTVLRDGLENNDFSNLEAHAIPINISGLLRTAPRAPDEMLRESFAFSIISRNCDLLDELLRKIRWKKVDIADLHPFHLATSFLDGSRTCCNVLDMLAQNSGLNLPISHTNELGHTILDNLMLTVIKSHTRCTPGDVDVRWARETRFPGAEVDICGRWDADSDCIRSLLAEGNAAIPIEWKHKFCHTSAQTIVHCMSSLFVAGTAAIRNPSGLYLKRCLLCGLKLELQPLHTLLLTSFALAQYGFDGEDLSGMLACLLCLLANGAEPLERVAISLSALYGAEQMEECDHELYDAAQLAERLHSHFAPLWSEAVTTGWEILIRVLKRSQRQWSHQEIGEEEVALPQLFASEVEGNNRDELLGTTSRAGNDFIDLTDIMDIDRPTSDHDSVFRASDSDDGYSVYDLKHKPTCRYNNYYYDEHRNYFRRDRILGLLWAAIRTEMLTYRRQSVDCLWSSANFDMSSIHECLIQNRVLDIGLIDKGLMKQPCRCGHFERDYFGLVTMEDVSSTYFANLEDWTRITVIPLPLRHEDY